MKNHCVNERIVILISEKGCSKINSRSIYNAPEFQKEAVFYNPIQVFII